MSKKKRAQELEVAEGIAILEYPAEGEASVSPVEEKPVKAKKEKKKKADKKAEKKAAKAEKKSKKHGKKQKESVTKKQNVFGSPVRNLIITALLSVVVGLAFILKASETYTYCGYGLGGLTALVGLVYIAIYFIRRPVSGVYRNEFAIGLVALLAGAYVAVGGLVFSDNSVTFTFNLVLKILGILLVLDGIMKVQSTLDVARMKYKLWWVCLITGVLGMALGVLLVMGLVYDIGVSIGTSIGNKYFYFIAYGAVFCLNGVLDIIAMAFIAHRNRLANKAANIAAAEAMMAGVKPEEVQDFFPEAGTSAEEVIVLSEEVPAEPAVTEEVSETVAEEEAPAAEE